jgi:hypothetical protein
VTAEESAAAWGVTQAAAWIGGQFGDELNGRQQRAIAAGVAEILLPYLKVSVVADLADGLHALDPTVVATDALADAYRAAVAEMLDEMKGGRG